MVLACLATRQVRGILGSAVRKLKRHRSTTSGPIGRRRGTAERQFAKLAARAREAVAAVFVTLGTNPRPPGCVKMAGPLDLWRVRVGNYRVVYQILDDKLLVTIVTLGDRKDVYR